MDHGVPFPMDLQDRYGRSFGAEARVLPGGAGEVDNARDQLRHFTGHAVGHEAVVGVFDEVYVLRIDVEVLLRLFDEPGQVGHIIDGRAVEVAVEVRRIPEAVSVEVLRSIRSDQQDPLVPGRITELEVEVLTCGRVREAVEQDYEWYRDGRVGVIG